jgi:hypothetical protein
MIINSILSLVKLAFNLDVGTVHSSTVPVILYISRLIARIDSYITCLIDHYDGKHTCLSTIMRDVTLLPENYDILNKGQQDIQYFVQNKLHGMLEKWNIELSNESESKEDDEVVDKNIQTSCQLHAHLLLLYRNIRTKVIHLFSFYFLSFFFFFFNYYFNFYNNYYFFY